VDHRPRIPQRLTHLPRDRLPASEQGLSTLCNRRDCYSVETGKDNAIRSQSDNTAGDAMKLLIVMIASSLPLALAPNCHAQSDDELQQALTRSISQNASDRISGFNELRQFWKQGTDSRPDASPNTLKRDAPPLNRQHDIPDEHVDQIALAIQRGLQDEEPSVREAAAIAIGSAPRPRPEVIAALRIGLNSGDTTVLWHISSHAAKTPPRIESVIDSLIRNLGSDEYTNFLAASDLLKAYGKTARPYGPRILEIVLIPKKTRSLKLYVLCDIGLTDPTANKLAEAATDFNERELGIAAVCLLDHPQLLKQLEKQRPETVSALQEQLPRLYQHLCKHQYAANETRFWLEESGDLLPVTMGLLRKPKFIEKIAAEATSAGPHRKSLLAACKRACGEPPLTQIQVDADHPVKFRPQSAWPNTDPDRQSKNRFHADGVTFLLFTGEVRDKAGEHPASIQFFRLNDKMLLGRKANERLDVLYDSSTGRFVCYTSVFAAYSMKPGQTEPGPYQTGSIQVRVDAEGCRSLTMQLFDEMPDVVITLDPLGQN
jgi:hypothetical protein